MKPRLHKRARKLLAESQAASEQPLIEETEKLRAEIRAAWEDAVYPGNDRIDGCECGRDECVAVAKYFTGKSWRDVKYAEMMSACGSSWDTPAAFLTPAAFRYFLPSFLLMYIGDWKHLDVLSEHIVRNVCPHEGWRRNIEGSSPAQQRTVLSFLIYVQKRYSNIANGEELQTGIKFWSERIDMDDGHPGGDRRP